MSGTGQPEYSIPDATDLTVGIVASLWNKGIVDNLLDRATTVASLAGVSVITARVPGAMEIPVVAQQFARTCDAVVALGVVIRGGTPHFEYVSQSVTSGLTRIALDEATPIGNGVLTVDNREQAIARSGIEGSDEDKGGEAMVAALETAITLRRLRTDTY